MDLSDTRYYINEFLLRITNRETAYNKHKEREIKKRILERKEERKTIG
jgi:hypothetical protein